YFGASSSEVYTKDLDLQQCGESVWTIDLAYMLAHYGIPHHLCTITLGANADHAKKAFYTSFNKDEERVNNLFADAAANGVSVERRSVTLEEVIEHLSHGNIAIILVDWSHMGCLWCDRGLRKGVIFFKNPNAHEALCCCRYDSLDKARKSHGTDEDILFVYPKETAHRSHRNQGETSDAEAVTSDQSL
ncbi:hypothetical protein BaRGS_00009657, partial [Batillaria attramentaria]